jgi:hypothetical protein
VVVTGGSREVPGRKPVTGDNNNILIIIIIIIPAMGRTVIEDVTVPHLTKKFPEVLYTAHTDPLHFRTLTENSDPSLARRFL